MPDKKTKSEGEAETPKTEEPKKTKVDLKETEKESKEETKPTEEKAEEKSKSKKVKRGKRRSVPKGKAYVHASYNNTIVTLTEPNGNVIAWSSSGSNGFKGARKATPYAAQISAENAAEKGKLYGLEQIDVFIKGVGTGREQAVRGLVSAGLDILSINDLTPIPHNGCRKKKMRRN